MPLRGMDFSRSNQAWARFNQFLAQDLLDRFRNDRDVDLMKVQDRLLKERQISAGEVEMRVATYKHALSEQEAYIKAMIDIGKQPEYTYLTSMAHMATDPNLPDEYRDPARKAAEKYASFIKPLALLAYNASRGEASWEDYQAAVEGGGLGLLESSMKEGGMSWRAKLSAQTEQDKLAAKGTETEAGQAEERTKRYISMLEKSISHLQGQGVQGTSMSGDVRIFMENKTLNPLSAENQDKALTGLLHLWQKVIDGGADVLTEGNKLFIQRVWAAGNWGPYSDSVATATPQVQTRGGVDLATGATPQEQVAAFESIRTTLINQKIQEFIAAVYGTESPTPAMIEEARKHATEYVDTRIMPAIRR